MENTEIKEMLALQKALIKSETLGIRSLKTKHRIACRNHISSWEILNELTTLRTKNSQRHYWYFMLKNLRKDKYQEIILNRINSIGAFQLNEAGAAEYIFKTLSGMKE